MVARNIPLILEDTALFVRPVMNYSASSLIRTSLIRILAYLNPQNYDIHDDIHNPYKFCCNAFSMGFTYPNFSLIRTFCFLVGSDK